MPSLEELSKLNKILPDIFSFSDEEVDTSKLYQRFGLEVKTDFKDEIKQYKTNWRRSWGTKL
jgi:hypothetical protein